MSAPSAIATHRNDMRRRAHASLLGLFVLGGVAMASSPACTQDEHCPANYAHCEGNVGHYCLESNAGEHHKADFATYPCRAGTFCQAGAESTICSLSPGPDPLCGAAQAAGRDRRCDGKGVVTCNGGFAVQRTECADACVAADGPCPTSGSQCPSAFCAVSPDPDPRCPAKAPQLSTFCDGNARGACAWGHVLAPPDDQDAGCAVGSACVDFEKATGKSCVFDPAGDTRTACVLSSPPIRDARCTADVEAFCEGNTLVRCSCGYLSGRESCDGKGMCTPQRGPVRFALCVR